MTTRAIGNHGRQGTFAGRCSLQKSKASRATWLFFALAGLTLACAGETPARSPQAQARAADSDRPVASQGPAGEVEALCRQAAAADAQGQLTQAQALLRRALARSWQLSPRPPRLIAKVLSQLAGNLVKSKQTAEARAAIAQAFALVRPGFIEDDRRIYTLRMILAESYCWEGKPAQALAPFAAAAQALRAHEAETASDLLVALGRLADTESELGLRVEAVRTLEAALAIAERYPSTRTETASTAARLIRAYAAEQRLDLAVALFRRYRMVVRRLDQNASGPVDIRIEDGFEIDPPAPSPPGATAALNTPTHGAVNDAALRVAEMRGRFRACYRQALTVDRTAEGRIHISILVGPDGTVNRVIGVAVGLSSDLVDCVLQRAASAQFQATGGYAKILVPVTFVRTQ